MNSDHGFDAELKCIVHSEPRAQVTWKKDGINIVNDKRFTLENHQHNHNLMIKNLEKSDFGVYTCAAVNYLDTTSKDIKLVRTPTILEFIKPQADLKDSVLAWRVASKAAISHYELQYRKKGVSISSICCVLCFFFLNCFWSVRNDRRAIGSWLNQK